MDADSPEHSTWRASSRTSLYAFAHSLSLANVEDAGASLKERLKRTQALVYVQRASYAALNASSAALSASSAVLATPAQLARSAGAYVSDVSAYVATERQALLAAALGWAVWPITIASRPIKVLRPRKAGAMQEEMLRLEVKLLNGSDLLLELPVEASLAEARDQVARSLGLPHRRQFLVVAEERVRGAGLGQLAARVGRHLAAPGDLRAGLVSWINFIFLPEAVNRELYGRGLIGSLKASTWYQQLQEKQKAGAKRIPASDGVRVQVETLAGKVLAVEVDAGASLGDMRVGIEREVGVGVKQQRLIILERTGPGALTHLTNRVFLHSLAGARSLVGAAAWAGCQLLGAGRPDNRFTLHVRTPAGGSLHLPVTGDMTLDQVREMVEIRTLAESAAAAAVSSAGNSDAADALGAAAAACAAATTAAAVAAVHGTSSPPSSPKGASTLVAHAAAAGALPLPAASPIVGLSEIGFPERMPPRRKPEASAFVRIVDT